MAPSGFLLIQKGGGGGEWTMKREEGGLCSGENSPRGDSLENQAPPSETSLAEHRPVQI